MKNKICIITTKFPSDDWGGLARTCERVAFCGRYYGLDVHIAHLVIEERSHILLDENRTTELRDGLTVHRIKVATNFASRKLGDCPHTLTLQMMYHSIEKLYLQEKFNLFHSFFLFPSGYIGGLLARRFNIPSIVTLAGNDINKYLFSPEKIAPSGIALQNADKIVALSNDLLEKTHCITPVKHKGIVIYNSVSIPEGVWKEPENEIFTVGCGGILKYAKGIPYLLKAIGEVGKKERVCLHLAGKVREEERDDYEKIVEKTGVEPCLIPPIPHDEITGWFMTLNLFVLPSLTEGCPNILMEAMAAGVPCIATETGANDVIIDNGKSGILVPWGDSKSLGEAIYEAMKNKNLRERIGKNGREKMKEFSSEREKKEWQKVYRYFLDF